MAVVAISDSNTRILDNEAGTVTGTSTTGLGGGAGVQLEPDIIWQGTQAWSRKISNTGGGWRWTAGSTIDMTASGNEVLMLKLNVTNFAAIDSYCELRLGQSSGNEQHYRFADDGTQTDIDYPPKGGWLIIPVDPNVTAWVDETNGTPDFTIVDNYVFYLNTMAASAKSENLIQDALDNGPGLWLVGGDSTDTDGVFQDFVDDDEGSITAGRFGHVTTQDGILFVFGRLNIGDTSAGTNTATEFTDANQTVVWPGGRVDAGWNGLRIDTGHASTVVNITNCTFVGRGRVGWKMFFDADHEVGSLGNRIQIDGDAATTPLLVPDLFQFDDGVAVQYSDEGGTAITGLTDLDELFVEMHTDGVEFYLHDGGIRRDAFLGGTGSRAALTALTGSENHSITIQPDTRPDLLLTGTTADACTFTGCTFNNFRDVTSITASYDFINCVFVNCRDITYGDGAALITGCSFLSPTIGPGDHQIDLTTAGGIDAITGCTFEGNYSSDKEPRWRGGHGIRITVVGDMTESFTDNDVDATTYGPNPGFFDASSSGDVNTLTNQITLDHDDFETGDEVFYNDRGGTPITGVTNAAMYYIRRISANVVSLHPTKYSADNDTDEIGFTGLGTLSGGKEHQLGSADAFFHIEQTVASDIIINVSGGATPTYRITGDGGTVTIQQSVTLTVNGLTENAYVDIIAGDTGPETEGTSLASGYANSSGVFSQGYSYSSDQSVIIRARKAGIVDGFLREQGGTKTDDRANARGRGEADVSIPMFTTLDTHGIAFGGLQKFNQVDIRVVTAKVATATHRWQYATALDTWSDLTVTDWNTIDSDKYEPDDWSAVGTVRITFDDPGAGWVATSEEDSVATPYGPYYWIRSISNAGGSWTSSPELSTLTLSGGDLKKYEPFNSTGTIKDTGLTVTAQWIEDTVIG